MFKERFMKAIVLSMVLFVFSSLVAAQGTTTRITGVVSDSSGAAVSAATVKIQRDGSDAEDSCEHEKFLFSGKTREGT